MFSSQFIVICALICACWAEDLSFPSGFKFGSATAAYQVEGAWNVTDKGESIWDRFSHEHPEFTNNDNGDVACDSYHKWREDVQIASDLGLHFYRFSIAWSRLLPSGYPNNVSADGSKYYNDLIDELLKNNIEPVVTVYHWDLPQKLQDIGGWTNPLIGDYLEDYARVIFSLYGDRVKTWITINEPLVICDFAYNTPYVAPGVPDVDKSMYLCNKNVLLAHARVWRLYDREFRALYNGKLSIDNHLLWLEPENDGDENITQLAREYHFGRYINPIYSKEGGWPPVIEQIIANNSKEQGYFRSRLPPFTEEERKLVQGTYDYFAFNHYTSRVIRSAKPGEVVPDWPNDGGIPEIGAIVSSRQEWPIAANGFFPIYPEAMRLMLNYLKERYGDHEFFIMENGYGGTDDGKRIEYINDYLNQILLAIKDGVNVIGYTYWSMIDNFDWASGYSIKYGLYNVDFSDPQRMRTPRNSAKYYSQVIKSNSLNVTLS